MPSWLQLACSLQPPRPSWHRSTTGGGREGGVGPGNRRGGEGSGLSTPAPLLTCAHAAVPFVAQATLTAVASAAHGLRRAGRSAHRLQLCPPGPTPHIQVSGCPPGLPPIRVCSWGKHWCVQGGHKHRATHPAAPHSVAPSSPPHRSRSQSLPGPHHSGRGRYSCRLGGGTGRAVLAHGPRRSGPGRAGPHSLPWHRGPKAPGAQSSQAVPVKRAWHLHSPLPLMPSMHVPRWLQGLLAPPGQARGGGEEGGEIGPRQEPRTCTPSLDTLHPPPSGNGGSGTSSHCALEDTRTPSPVHQDPYHLHSHLCSEHSPVGPLTPSLTTPSPFLRLSGQSCAPGRLGSWEGRSAGSAASGHLPRHSLP